MKRLALILSLSVPTSLLAGEAELASPPSSEIPDAGSSRLTLLQISELVGPTASRGQIAKLRSVDGMSDSPSNPRLLGSNERGAALAAADTCQGSVPLGVGSTMLASGGGSCDVPYPLCTGPSPYPGRTCCVILPHIPNVGRVWFCLRQVNPPFEFETVASGICN